MAVDSTGFNPYAMQYGLTAQNGLSDDFMWNAYMANSQKTAQGGQQQTFTGSNLSGQPATDCYQSSSGFGTGVKLALAGGAGTALGMYYFGGDKVSPLVNKEWNDTFLKTLEEDSTFIKKAEELKTAKISEIFGTPVSERQYSAIKELAEKGTLPKDVVLPDALKTMTADQAKDYVAKVNKITAEELAQEVSRTHSLNGSTSYLSELNARKSKLTSLAKDISEADLAKHLQENAKLYGIKGADEAAIKAATEAEAKKGLSALISENASNITTQEKNVKDVRQALIDKVAPHWDTTKNALRDGAPENIQKAVKNFKFTKAGKAGLIAAGVGLVLGWMFGGKS